MSNFWHKATRIDTFLFLFGAIGVVMTLGGAALIVSGIFMEIEEVRDYGVQSIITGFVIMIIGYLLPPILHKRNDKKNEVND